MELAIINAILYIGLFIYSCRTHRILSLGLVLTALYALVAIMCVFTIEKTNIYQWNLSLWPFLYLFVAFVISARPFIDNKIDSSYFQISNFKLCVTIVIVMAIAAIINIYYSIGSFVLLPVEDEFAEIYTDKDSMAQSSNILDWICKNINSYFIIPFSVVSFYLISKGSKAIRSVSLMALLIVFIALFINALSRGGRWFIIYYFAVLLSGYIILYKQIEQRLRTRINLYIAAIGVVFVTYIIIIAFSRFSGIGTTYGGDVNASLVYYAGHSMLTFNDGIVDSINRYLWGDFFIGSELIQGKELDPILGTHFGSRFFTYIGGFYLDFGPIITLLLCALMGSVLRRKSKIKNLSDAYFVCYFYVFIFMGVFVHGRGYGISWLICFTIYLMLKIVK